MNLMQSAVQQSACRKIHTGGNNRIVLKITILIIEQLKTTIFKILIYLNLIISKMNNIEKNNTQNNNIQKNNILNNNIHMKNTLIKQYCR